MKKLKRFLMFFILLLLYFIFTFNFSMIEVNALTTTDVDKETSVINIKAKDSNHTYSENFNYMNFVLNDKVYDFATNIYFNDISSIPQSGSLYITYHFKYFYDISDTETYHFKDDTWRTETSSYSFSTTYGSIYEEKLYTSISEFGVYTYDYFITLEFTRFDNNWTYYSDDNHFHFYAYSKSYPDAKYTKFGAQVVYTMFTDENVIPQSIDEYISNQDIIYYDPVDEPYQDTTDHSILGYLKRVWNNTLSFFRRIINFINNIPYYTIKGLTYLFVPSEGFITDKIMAQYNYVRNQLGFLFQPFELLLQVLYSYQGLSDSSSGVIHIPNIRDPFYNQLLISEQDYDIKSVFQDNGLSSYYNLYLDIVDVIFVIYLINLYIKCFNTVFSKEGDKE